MASSVDLIGIPLSHPILFWSVAGVLSVYHGIRGILIQGWARANENIELLARKNPAPGRPWTRSEVIYVHRVHDFIFHVVCSLTGFLSLFLVSMILTGVPNLSEIGTGTAILGSFLLLMAVTGIAGVLAPVLMYGKVFTKP